MILNSVLIMFQTLTEFKKWVLVPHFLKILLGLSGPSPLLEICLCHEDFTAVSA